MQAITHPSPAIGIITLPLKKENEQEISKIS
jgi:hypothetical protein